MDYLTQGQAGLKGQYFKNMDLTNPAFERVDSTIDFDWGRAAPDSRVGVDNFSVRWTGFVEAKYSQTYTFYIIGDDGIRLYVNDKLVVSDWSNHGPRERSGTIDLKAGQNYPIKLEYYESTGGAVAKLLWSSPSQAKQVIPAQQLKTEIVQDLCPNDPNKTEPGLCGCGVPEGTCGSGGGGQIANIALGKPTSQSSLAYSGEASRAVDGNTSGQYGDKSVTHTEHETAPWWKVDLGGSFYVEEVVIFNRTDCCGDRLSNFHVDYLDASGKVLAAKTYTGKAGVETSFDLAVQGVYAVRVQLNGTNPLSLAEVQVFGAPGAGGTHKCAEVNENATAQLSCPSGQSISSILFASYGLPNGTCDSGFELGTCHATTSKSVVESACLGQTSCSVNARNSIFGDPCSGKGKRLKVSYACGTGGILDLCPDDPNKTSPGQCGCGVPEGACNTVSLHRIAGNHLRIGDYNVLRSSVFPRDNGDPQGNQARIDAFARIAKAVNADVWAMQELLYDGKDQPGRTPAGVRKHLASITGVNWNMAHHPDYQEFIFSRYPILASGSPGRRAVWALIDVGNDKNPQNDVLVVSVHYVTDGQGESTANFVSDVMAGKYSKIPRDVTIVVTGDFNNQPTQSRYAAMRSAIGVPDLRPIWLGTPSTTYTHGGVTYRNGTFTASAGGNPIDYIFARTNSSYSVARSFILSTLVLDQSVLDAHKLKRLDVAINPAQALVEGQRVDCDHFPLFVDLRPTR
jgi:endonuclease/exonuclease/phosphatase family metal-dependent hydrolase